MPAGLPLCGPRYHELDALVLLDGQHRLWAILLSGTTITTVVVTNVPALPHLFAYIRNVKAHSPAARMQIAGDNEVSPTIAAFLKIAICKISTDVRRTYRHRESSALVRERSRNARPRRESRLHVADRGRCSSCRQ